MTPHISAKKNEIADFVLMPGNPQRAETMAHRYLENVKLVSSVRSALMFTGTYKNRPISICASGIGMASMSIYAYELFKFYDVKTIIRVGSAGSYKKDLKVYDLVLANSAFSENSQIAGILQANASNLAYPDLNLNAKIVAKAKALNYPLAKGLIYTTDLFYNNRSLDEIQKVTNGAIAADMEAFSLFTVAKLFNKSAATLLTISNNMVTNAKTTAEESKNNFDKMIILALETSL